MATNLTHACAHALICLSDVTVSDQHWSLTENLNLISTKHYRTLSDVVNVTRQPMSNLSLWPWSLSFWTENDDEIPQHHHHVTVARPNYTRALQCIRRCLFVVQRSRLKFDLASTSTASIQSANRRWYVVMCVIRHSPLKTTYQIP